MNNDEFDKDKVDTTVSDAEGPRIRKTISRRELLRSGGKAAYVAPALLLLGPVKVYAQVGGSPPCDPNDPGCPTNSVPNSVPPNRVPPNRVPPGKNKKGKPADKKGGD